jgi:hypothetical protein
MARNDRHRASCGCLLGRRAGGIGDADPDGCLVVRFDYVARALGHAGSDPDVDPDAGFDAECAAGLQRAPQCRASHGAGHGHRPLSKLHRGRAFRLV